MFNSSQSSKDINSIKYLHKERKIWFYEKDNEWLKLDINEDVFLSEFKQFIKINAFSIINFSYIDDYLLNTIDGFFVVDGKRFDIARRAIPKTRAAHKKYLSQKYPKTKTIKITWGNRKKDNSLDIIIKNEINNIKYLIRKGYVTTIYYVNSSPRQFYDTLKYFEARFEATEPMLSINRNCIINTRLIESCIVDMRRKTGKIIIDTESFNVSRRLFPALKRKIRANDATFKLQKNRPPS